MNHQIFEEWFKDVLQWLNEKYPHAKVAIVIDNASYHSRLKPDCVVPKSNWCKSTVIDWMRRNSGVPPELLPGYRPPDVVNQLALEAAERGVPFSYVQPEFNREQSQLYSVHQYAGLTKAVLLSKIPKRPKVCVVDEMAKAAGIELVRLLPYHCEFNPIE